MSLLPENKIGDLSTIDTQNMSHEAEAEITPRIRMKHISHLDLDGYGSTLLSEYVAESYPEGFFYLETENILPSKLNDMMAEVIEDLDNWDIVVVTDLSINKDLIDMISGCKNPGKIHIFDHHEYDTDAIPELPDSVIVRQHIDPEKPAGKLTCATALYFSFLVNDPIYKLVDIKNTSVVNGVPFHRDPAEYFVECVRIYDTFEFWPTRNDNPNELTMSYFEAPRLNTLFHILERTEFKEYIKDYFNNRKDFLTVPSKEYPHVGELLRLEGFKNKRYVDAALRRLIHSDFVCTVWRDGVPHELNYKIGVVFAEKNGPVIGNTACENFDDIAFCAVVSNNQVSLYTNRPDVNVRDIATLFGGGGHAEASGFTIPYINANVFNLQHFFNIIECAGRITPGQFTGVNPKQPCMEDMSDTN